MERLCSSRYILAAGGDVFNIQVSFRMEQETQIGCNKERDSDFDKNFLQKSAILEFPLLPWSRFTSLAMKAG